jgi:hypothetical protein
MRYFAFALALAFTTTGCPDDPTPPRWATVATELPSALLAVSGTSPTDVWTVGADKGQGPLVLHFDGTAWETKATGHRGTLWWVHAFPNGPVFMAGSHNLMLRYENGKFERMVTPGIARHTIFGVWGTRPDDVYAVGSIAGRNGFVWHYDGVAWAEVALPELPELPPAPTGAKGDRPGLFKVWGSPDGTMWIVGARGVALKKPLGGDFERIDTETTSTLFTVAGEDGHTTIVGGGAEAVLLDGDNDSLSSEVVANVSILQGVAYGPDGKGWACGEKGSIFERTAKGWRQVDTDLELDVQSLHALWVDPEGGVWAVGGNVLTVSLDAGAIVHLGKSPVPTAVAPAPPAPVLTCPADAVELAPGESIARRWSEHILNSIRRDIPRPGVHARNLYHLSAAMWDAWAAFDATADGVFSTEKVELSAFSDGDLFAKARDEAISYAAFRVLSHRYAPSLATGGEVSNDCYQKFMVSLGYDPADAGTEGSSPRALGNRIGAAVIAAAQNDGANEAEAYKDTTGYTSFNPPLVVEDPGIRVTDPDIWQPVNLAEAETQNGLPIGAGTQEYIGSNWDLVIPFALDRPDAADLYLDPGPLPSIKDPEMKQWVADVLVRHGKHDPDAPETLDISPGAYGNNPLGSNAGTGHPMNPVTGQPYAPNVVPVGDFVRVMAEMWADGPKSETPPGHWNSLANDVTDSPGFVRKLHGEGPELPALEWDVKMYLAINGAVHDAAVVAWGTKRRFLGPRPITLARYMCGLGQSSDPNQPSYAEGGIPLVPGHIEVITEASSAPGERHAHLRHYVGEITVLSWRGEPGDRANETAGVAWMRCAEWMPYQRRTFVTPAFPGFISGHSTFSRAGAEVLTLMTGTPFFPGGLDEFVAKAHNYLIFEDGPSQDIRLQWATYYDAADQAGQSRLWGGIHIEPDDFMGRILGSMVGEGAYAKASTYFDGTAR